MFHTGYPVSQTDWSWYVAVIGYRYRFMVSLSKLFISRLSSFLYDSVSSALLRASTSNQLKLWHGAGR